MATWTDRLTRARWRNFEFLTDALESTHGQRLIVTELPGSDEPVVEDLGAKAATYKLSAYFLGAQYDLERNAFLGLLATPGAAWLYRPLMVDVWVRAQTWSVRESTDKGGYCTVTVDFVPGGQQLSAPQVDMADTAFGLVAAMMESADFEPEAMSEDEQAVFVERVQSALDLVRYALAMARAPLTWALQVQAEINTVKGLINEALALPGEYAQVMRSLANSLASTPDSDSSTGETTTDVQRTRTVAALARSAKSAATESLVGLQTTRLRSNVQGDIAMRATQMAAAAMTVALADYRDATARSSAIRTVLELLELMMPLQSDTAFAATANARAALLQVLAAQTDVEEVLRDVVRPLPAVVLALDMEVDEGLLLTRNAVRHPLFVQGRVYG
jgi:prophage DNA circulation protein